MFTAKISWIFVQAFKKISRKMRVSSGLAATVGMIFRLYSEFFVEIQALFLEILRFEFVTLFVKHPVAWDA